MNKETLMKMDKESLVDALIEVSEANISLNHSLTKIETSLKFIFPNSEEIGKNLNVIRKELKDIYSTFDKEEERQKALKDYFNKMK